MTPSAKRGSLTPADGNDSLPGPADAADLAAAAGLILRCASSKPSARVSSTAALLQRVVELGAPPEDLPSHSEGPATARGLPQKAVADAAVRLDVLERGLEAAASAAEAIRDSLGSGRGVGGSTCKGGRGKFRRAEGWLPCAVGSLPDALRLSGRVPDLTEAASRPAGRGCAGERGGTQGGDAGTHLGREVEGVGVEEGEGWRAEEESPGMDVDIDDEHEGWEGALAGTGERGVMQVSGSVFVPKCDESGRT